METAADGGANTYDLINNFLSSSDVMQGTDQHSVVFVFDDYAILRDFFSGS